MGAGVASFLLLPPRLPRAVFAQPHSFRFANRQVLFFQRESLGQAIAFLDARWREASRHERKTRQGSYKNRQSGNSGTDGKLGDRETRETREKLGGNSGTDGTFSDTLW